MKPWQANDVAHALELEGAIAIGVLGVIGVCGEVAAPQLHGQTCVVEAALQRAELKADSVVASAEVRKPRSLEDTTAGRHNEAAP